MTVAVDGGAAGIEAVYADICAVAAALGAEGLAVTRTAAVLHAALAAPLGTSLLDPFGAAHYQAELLYALHGPGGVARIAARTTGLAVLVRAAVESYRAADEATEVPRTVAELAARAPTTTVAVGRELLDLDASGAAQALLTEHAGHIELAARLAGIGELLLDPEPGAPPAGLLWPDGRPTVDGLGRDAAADRAGPPRTLTDLLAALDHRNSATSGEIDVRTMNRPDGGRSVVVNIPGTKDWRLARDNPDVTSLATNVRAVAGEPTAYEAGVLEALRRAGVTPADDVLLVGHSQGGLVAVNAAARLAQTGEFTVRQVITAGSPLGLVLDGLPPEVRVLAIENSADLVPHLDTRPNGGSATVTTVTVHRQHGDVIANHSLQDTYVPAAAEVADSRHPSIQAALRDLRPWLRGVDISTVVFRVKRA